MLQLKSFNEFLIDEFLSEKLSDSWGRYFSLTVQKGKKIQEIPIYSEEIKSIPYDLVSNLKTYQNVSKENDNAILNLFDKGLRFIVLMDLTKEKFFIFIWPQSILHNDMMKCFDENQKVLSELNITEGHNYSFSKLYHNLSIAPETKQSSFVFPGAFLFESDKLVSNTSKYVLEQLNTELKEQSNEKYSLEHIVKIDSKYYKTLFQ